MCFAACVWSQVQPPPLFWQSGTIVQIKRRNEDIWLKRGFVHVIRGWIIHQFIIRILFGVQFFLPDYLFLQRLFRISGSCVKHHLASTALWLFLCGSRRCHGWVKLLWLLAGFFMSCCIPGHFCHVAHSLSPSLISERFSILCESRSFSICSDWTKPMPLKVTQRNLPCIPVF